MTTQYDWVQIDIIVVSYSYIGIYRTMEPTYFQIGRKKLH